MRTVAAIPAIGLLAGSGLGFIFADGVARPAYVVLALSVALAACGWRARRPQLGAAAVAIGFAAGGALLAADAWQRAWRPAVRVRFEALARAERARASTAHRALPVDDEAAAVVVGVLRADAAETEAGVSLSLDAEELRPLDGDAPDAAVVLSGVSNGVSNRVSGGVLVSVAGTLAPAHLAEWRAGRRVRMPLRLHRPSRYLDPGVADGERALARRGISLVGTVKSGALVEVLGLGPWWEEAASRVRLFARTAIGRAVGRWSPRSAGIVAAIVIGDRVGLDRDVQRRLQEAGTYHVIAISGGNIAILAGLLLLVCRFAGVLGRAAMLSAIVLLVAYAYLVGGGASVSRATLSAGAAFAARAWDQRGPPLNTFWAVVAVLVVCAPLSS
ncbi:MAG: ComEC/Rec2 family competence protein, partial [Acidobacteriota bacterium]